MTPHNKNKAPMAIKATMMLIIGLLSGCGVIQSVKDNTIDVAKAIFIKDIKILHLDFAARAQLNPGDADAPSSVVIRVYQLGKIDNFDNATYSQLLEGDQKALGADWLSTSEVVLNPASAISLDVPMHKEARMVGIVALFRTPNLDDSSWKVVIKRNELDADKPRLLIANHSAIGLVTVK